MTTILGMLSLDYCFILCDSGATRTRDPQLRRLLLYPTELRNPVQAAKIRFFSICTTSIDIEQVKH